ncbi:MAG TPA: hypothetical protein VLC98_06690 [Phnomibacter sp.]|nr:hypothetical protein [Phnomibacter sp.]
MKGIIKTLSTLALIIAFASCKEEQAKSCEIKEIRTLFTTVGIHDTDTTYAHYALIKDYSRECMDSTTFVDVALKYCDTVKVGKPADIIMFFNSDKNFIPNETSQVMEKINKSCLVVIGFDEGKPNTFIFYDNKGERVYWGARWLPNGE